MGDVFGAVGVTGMFESLRIFNKTTAGCRCFAFPALTYRGELVSGQEMHTQSKSYIIKTAAKNKESGHSKTSSVLPCSLLCLFNAPSSCISIPSTLLSPHTDSHASLHLV